jgi:hypothetical protein
VESFGCPYGPVPVGIGDGNLGVGMASWTEDLGKVEK